MTPEDLVEMEQIKQLKYRYLRCLDQKLWDEIETCFLPDTTARYGGGLYEFEGNVDCLVGAHGIQSGVDAVGRHIANPIGESIAVFDRNAPEL